MSYIEDYDVVVLGSGEAGKYLAWHFAGMGKSVAVIERRYVGGSCPNIACLPSKNVIHSAKVASYFQRGKEFGMIADNFDIYKAFYFLAGTIVFANLLILLMPKEQASHKARPVPAS